MKIEKQIQIELSTDEIKDLIIDHLKDQGFDVNRSDIVFQANAITKCFSGVKIRISCPNVE